MSTTDNHPYKNTSSQNEPQQDPPLPTEPTTPPPNPQTKMSHSPQTPEDHLDAAIAKLIAEENLAVEKTKVDIYLTFVNPETNEERPIPLLTNHFRRSIRETRTLLRLYMTLQTSAAIFDARRAVPPLRLGEDVERVVYNFPETVDFMRSRDAPLDNEAYDNWAYWDGLIFTDDQREMNNYERPSIDVVVRERAVRAWAQRRMVTTGHIPSRIEVHALPNKD